MPRESLTIGPTHTLTQNVVYALPARSVIIFSNLALEIANEETFAVAQAIPAATATEIAGAFVRCTTGNALVVVKSR